MRVINGKSTQYRGKIDRRTWIGIDHPLGSIRSGKGYIRQRIRMEGKIHEESNILKNVRIHNECKVNDISSYDG